MEATSAAAKRGLCEALGRPCSECDIREVSVCGSLDDHELEKVRSIVRLVNCEAGDVVVHEGDSAEFLFNVVAGAVRLHKLLPDGRRQVTGFLFAGDFLGLAFNQTYSYTAEAVTATRLCRFPRVKYEAVLAELPNLERRLLADAAHELTAAQDQMLLLGRKSAVERVASFLSLLARRAKSGSGSVVVEVPMTRADIADYLGLTIETVSRTISQLKRAGTIRLLGRDRIQLTDRASLGALTDGA